MDTLGDGSLTNPPTSAKTLHMVGAEAMTTALNPKNIVNRGVLQQQPAVSRISQLQLSRRVTCNQPAY